MHQFGIKVLPGTFVGYSLRVGGGWTGDLRIVDWEDLGKAETVSYVKIKRFKAAEVNVSKTPVRRRLPTAICKRDDAPSKDEKEKARRS